MQIINAFSSDEAKEIMNNIARIFNGRIAAKARSYCPNKMELCYEMHKTAKLTPVFDGKKDKTIKFKYFYLKFTPYGFSVRFVNVTRKKSDYGYYDMIFNDIAEHNFSVINQGSIQDTLRIVKEQLRNLTGVAFEVPTVIFR